MTVNEGAMDVGGLDRVSLRLRPGVVWGCTGLDDDWAGFGAECQGWTTCWTTRLDAWNESSWDRRMSIRADSRALVRLMIQC